ncbi:MAG: hypothetical protein HW407_1061 [Bacteroidetes bacterium]|nr:hypothetical protein [Bacteroidota bacterium]
MFKMEHWLPLLSCDRCADYHEEKNRLRERIGKAAYATQRLRFMGAWNEGSEKVAREKLAGLTQAFAELVCRHYRKVTVWEPEFVDMLIGKPEEVNRILDRYVKGVR